MSSVNVPFTRQCHLLSPPPRTTPHVNNVAPFRYGPETKICQGDRDMRKKSEAGCEKSEDCVQMRERDNINY